MQTTHSKSYDLQDTSTKFVLVCQGRDNQNRLENEEKKTFTSRASDENMFGQAPSFG